MRVFRDEAIDGLETRGFGIGHLGSENSIITFEPTTNIIYRLRRNT